MTTIWVATEKGLYRADDPEVVTEGRVADVIATGHGGWVALVDGALRGALQGARQGDAGLDVDLPGPGPTCLLQEDGFFLVGTSEAHLLHVAADGSRVEPVASFEKAEGRDRWYTPWGGPPDTRSLSCAEDGTFYVNVHVGGILRSEDGTASWAPTIDIDADVHQVLTSGDLVLAANAYGLAISRDRGLTWAFETEGLHAEYSRAVAIAGDWLLLSASTGPRGERAAVYRRPLDAPSGSPFERSRTGLPEWFDGNIDTRCLVARGESAVLGTGDGTLYRSDDAGASWELLTADLPPIIALALA
ncbi:MAG: hypothetical protein M3314_11975 [Actinomycetota bacterium]|nr:hypothetical protein [Actinomycetota bacterium]